MSKTVEGTLLGALFIALVICVIFALKGFVIMLAWNYVIINLIAGAQAMSFLQGFVLAALWSFIAYGNSKVEGN